jgi:hypothetical protein
VPQPPPDPKIYHIVHIDRLPSVIADGCLWSDAVMVQRSGAGTVIGMNAIKQRRLGLPVSCHPGDCVGHFVPFYFCPRSIMLYVIHRANHPDLAYRGGQEPIIHLEADLNRVIAWANANGRKWAFSLSNAGAFYTQFRSNVGQLGEVNWPAIAANDFRRADVGEGKQAEFLLHHLFPWGLIERIGVFSQGVAQHAANAMKGAVHRPRLEIRTEWYF